MQLAERARSLNLSLPELLAQGDITPPSPAAVALLRLMFYDEAMRRPVGRERLAELLSRYAEQAEQLRPGPDMFGNAEITAPDILRALAGTNQRVADAADALMQAARHPPRDEDAAASLRAAAAKEADDAPIGQGALLMPEARPEPKPEPAAATPASRLPGETARPIGVTMEQLLKLPEADAHFVLTADNQRFVALEPDNPNLGMAPRAEGEGGEIPIRLRRADARHIRDPRHADDAAILGYADPLQLVADVARNWEQMIPGRDGRIQLVRRGPANAVAVVELAKADRADYWRVVTAGRRAGAQLGEPLAVRSPLPDTAPGTQTLSQRPPDMSGHGERLAQGRNGSRDIASAAPAFNAKLSPELEHATRLADEAVAAVRTEAQAGRLSEADLAPLRAADEGVRTAQADAEAAREAAACLIARGSVA